MFPPANAHFQPFRVRALALCISCVLMSLAVSTGWASGFQCADADAVVLFEGELDPESTCEGASAAIRILEGIGVARDLPVEINIVDRLPPGLRDAFGCYDRSRDGVFLLGPKSCLEGSGLPEPFKIANDEALYKSYVAHEVAHAIAAENFTFEHPSAVAHEYIAGVVQMSVLDSEKRAEILGKFSGDGYDSPVEINLLHYQIDPARFAVEAYRHYKKIKDGPQFVRDLLDGSVRLKDQPTY